MSARRWNLSLWLGFVLCLTGVASYLPLSRYPITRDVPWVSYLLFAVGLLLIAAGLQRAFGKPVEYRGKIFGPILAALSLVIVGFFCFAILYGAKQIPKSANAPRVGDKIPDFSLVDSDNQTVTLASLLSTPLPGSQNAPKGVLLIFYRGYW